MFFLYFCIMNGLSRIIYVSLVLVAFIFPTISFAEGNVVVTGQNDIGDNGNVSQPAISNSILYICSYNTDSRSTAETLESFVKRCNEIDPSRQVIIESMECTSLKELFSFKGRMKVILNKYMANGHSPALIVLMGREAVSTYLSLDEPMYKKIPIAVGSCSANIISLPSDSMDIRNWKPVSKDIRSDFRDFNIVGGILKYFDIDKNLQIINKLYPKISDIYLLTDNSLGGVAMQSLVRTKLTGAHAGKIHYIDGRTASYDEILKNIRRLKNNSALLLGTWRVDCNENFALGNSTKQIREANPELPVFTISGIGMNGLAIGGYYPDFRLDGERLSEICMAYLENFESQGLVYVSNSSNFDYQLIESFKLSKDSLPSQSNLLNAPVSFIEEYKDWFIGAGILAVILILSQLLTLHFMFKLRRMKEELQAQSEELMIAKDKAEESNRMKSAFLANMSHEIRTPLNAIVGFSELIATRNNTLSDEERAQFRDIINQNSNQLLNLINDVLDLSRIESGKIIMDLGMCNISKLCNAVLESVKVTCRKPIDFVFNCDIDNVSFVTDEVRLRQVLINLLTNSVKFSEKGVISITLSVNPKVNIAKFSVSDNGCGIKKENEEKVFERFVKLNQFKQGTGLGLQICRQIIERLGGKIWLDTNYTEGAKFSFIHPIDLKE